MKVSELIKLLADCDKDGEVLISLGSPERIKKVEFPATPEIVKVVNDEAFVYLRTWKER